MKKIVSITTIDNPYDPVNKFDEWLSYDNMKGYGTLSYLDRIIQLINPEEILDEDYANEQAIDQIIKYDPLGIYKKVIIEQAV